MVSDLFVRAVLQGTVHNIMLCTLITRRKFWSNELNVAGWRAWMPTKRTLHESRIEDDHPSRDLERHMKC